MNERDGGQADQHEFDLRAAVRGLAAAPAQSGRRQTVLLRHGRLTVILFTFDAGAGLPDHRALGVVTKVTLDMQPAFTMRQDVYLDLPMAQVSDHFEDIMAAGYSVSLFTDWQRGRVAEVWVKRRVEPGDGP